MAVALDEWVRCLDNEYLAEFIADGGSAVRLIVAPNVDAVDTALATLAGVALEWGYGLAWWMRGRPKSSSSSSFFTRLRARLTGKRELSTGFEGS